MFVSNIFIGMPCWYILTMIAFSLFYAYRGIREKKLFPSYEIKNTVDKIIIDYIQEFLFKVIFTVSGFFSLYLAKYIIESLAPPYKDISGGTSVLLIFLIIWGILGISGYLTLFIQQGKLPYSGSGSS